MKDGELSIMQILKLLHADLIFPNLETVDRDDLFNKMCTILNEKGFVKASFLKGISNREKIYPTGLEMGNYGCALPHTDVEHVINPAIAIATLKRPVKFNVMGDSSNEVEVNIIFMLALHKKEDQVVILKELATLIQNVDVITAIREATSGNEILEIIKNSDNFTI
ncbi:MAG: PTS sugar transporter subunit IIA [Megasphaera sp.]|jgi:PTS system galactitol-specific IIA component|nr:PTS sugar transporter subunit IIA [Megasphaera sp.]MCI1823698.1 PTS sugar transporter subunit IIA [Megasphaera sp.]